jgi:Flp pilus assembly CpaE family ATPase
MKRFIDAVQGARLNRRRTTAILGRVVAAMNIDPSDLMRYVRKIKKGL